MTGSEIVAYKKYLWLDLICSVPTFRHLHEETLGKIADALEEVRSFLLGEVFNPIT